MKTSSSRLSPSMLPFVLTIFTGVALARADSDVLTIESREGFQVAAPPMGSPPKIDGEIKPKEWNGAVTFAGGAYNRPVKRGPVDPRLAYFHLGYDQDYVYVAFQTETPQHGSLIDSGKTERDVLRDDTVEIVLDPRGERPDGELKHGFFQLIANSKGETFKRHNQPGWGLSHQPWTPRFTQAHSVKDGLWTAEFAIPVADLGLEKIQCPMDIGFVLSRNFQQPRSFASVISGYDFSKSDHHSVLACRRQTPVVQVTYPNWAEKAGREARVEARNPGDQPVELHGVIRYSPGPDELKITDVRIPPGGTTVFNVDCPEPSDERHFSVDLRRGELVVYRRDVLFKRFAGKKWTGPGSSLVFKLDFDKEGFTPSVAVNPKVKVLGKPKIERDGEGGSFGWFPKGASVVYPAANLPVPGAVCCRIKTSPPPCEGENRGIWITAFQPGGYFYLFENHDHLVLNFQGFPWSRGDEGLSIAWPKPANGLKSFYTVLVNLGERQASMYVEGQLVGKVYYPKSPSPHGAFRLGWPTDSIGGVAFDEVKIYDRAFSEREIDLLGLRKGYLKGDISYVPSQGKVVVEAFLNSRELPKNPSLSLKIVDDGGETVKTYPLDVDRDFAVMPGDDRPLLRRGFDLPELTDGTYRRFIEIDSPEFAMPARALAGDFLVKRYPWADNQLGLGETLVPPFTPLRVEGKKVSCLLKRYVLGENGLPREIFADGSNILAAPVDLNVTRGGRRLPWRNSRLTFTRKSDANVVYESNSENDAIKLKTRGDFDYDGFLKLDFEFTPVDENPIDRICLDIPVKQEYAKLFHAAATGNRKNPAGQLPPGQGVIWRGRSVQHSFDNFIPYVWVGEERKGICYLADTDLDWVINDSRDTVEILRERDGTVIIRLNLFEGPAPLGRRRNIELGLMASPVKPMPEGWRGWSDYAAVYHLPGNTHLHGVLSQPCWGAFYWCAGQYPLGGDYEIIRKLDETRRTGRVDRKFINQFAEKVVGAWRSGKLNFNDYPVNHKPDVQTPEDMRKYALRYLNWGFNQMRDLSEHENSRWYVYYTCLHAPKSSLPEYPVYRDEWKCEHVVRSFRDYAIYHASKLLDNGVEGFYLDNTCLAAKDQWPTGDGYVDAEGRKHLSAGAWRIRSYVKRLATLMAEKGLPPLICVHNTNSHALPLYSFAQITLGEEWKYGDADYQDRFSPDYFRVVTFGRQLGAYPSAIGGIQTDDPEKAKWVTRTMLAAFLPHEIQPAMIVPPAGRPIIREAWDILWNFGRAESDCEFHGYWDQDVPAKSETNDLLVSCYQRGNKLLLAIGEYGQGGEKRIKIDIPLLKSDKIETAVNKETGRALSIVNGDTVVLPIKKHDFALVEVTLR